MKEAPKDVYIINQIFSFDVKLLHCGLETKESHHLEPGSVDRYVFSYLVEGEGFYTLKNREYVIRKGDAYLIPPSEIFHQQNNPKNPYRYYYVAMYGSACKDMFERAGLSAACPVLPLGSPFVEERMKEIFDLVAENTFSSIARANVVFFQIMCHLFSLRPDNNRPHDLSKNVYIEQVQWFVQNNYFYNITCQDIADYLHVNRTYLSSLFKEGYGASIKSYIDEYRIHQANNLLLNTDLSVSKVADKTGFGDPASFYRQFKSKMGLSPKQYRTVNKKSR